MAQPMLQTNQVAEALNEAMQPFWGQADLIEADLTNIVDFGNRYENLTQGQLSVLHGDFVTRITKDIFVMPEFVMDTIDIIKSRGVIGGPMGITAKYRTLPRKSENDPAYNPVAGETNDPFINYPLELVSSYYLNQNAEMFPLSIYDTIFQGLFNGADSAMRVVALLEAAIQQGVVMHIETLAKWTINAHAGAALIYGQPTQRRNLLKEFNTRFGTSITVDEAFQNSDFARYVFEQFNNSVKRLTNANALMNVKKTVTSSAENNTHFLINSDFMNTAVSWFASDLRHLKFLNLERHREVLSWQGLGTESGFTDISTIDLKVKLDDETPVVIKQSGVIAMAFAHDSVGLYNVAEKTTSQYDPIGLKTNFYTHVAASTMVDTNEDFVVFYIAEDEDDMVAQAHAVSGKAVASKAKAK